MECNHLKLCNERCFSGFWGGLKLGQFLGVYCLYEFNINVLLLVFKSDKI